MRGLPLARWLSRCKKTNLTNEIDWQKSRRKPGIFFPAVMARLCFHLFFLAILMSGSLAIPLPPPEAYFALISDRPYASEDDLTNAPPLFLLLGLLLLFMICLLLYIAQRFDRSI